MILITGATGQVGGEVAKQLSGMGIHYRALVRNPEKASTIAALGAEVVQGDLEKPETLNAAMRGIEKVFLLSPSGPEQLEREGNATEAAKRAGVKHIIKLSVFGASPFSPIVLGQWHWYSEKNIEESGIPFTFVRPTLFMQNFRQFASTIKTEGKIYAPAGDAKVSFIDARDIAAVAVAALTKPGHENKVYEITGPEALSYDEMAKSFSEAIGKPVAYMNIPPDVTRQAMLEVGLPEWLIEDSLYYYEYGRSGHALTVTHWVGRVAEKQPYMFAAFACDYAAAFMSE